MKKIISLFMVLAIVASFGMTAFAAGEDVTASLAVNQNSFTVGDGTDNKVEVTVTQTFTFKGGLNVGAFQTGVNVGSLTVKSGSYDGSAASALLKQADLCEGSVVSYMYMDDVNFTTFTTTEGQSVAVTFVVEVNTAEAGTYIITQASEAQALNGEDFETAYTLSTADPVTITVKAAEVPKTNVVIEAPEVETSTDTYADGSYNAGFLTSFTVDGTKNNPVSGVTFAINNGSETKTKAVSLGTTVTSGTVKVALNILKVKSGVTLEAVSVTPVAPAAN